MQACSVLHVAHVLVGVRRVTVVMVHIGHEDVVVVIHFCVAIFVRDFLYQEMFSLQIRSLKVIYTDNSLEFGKACEDLSWNHCTSTPHRTETKSIAERAVRRVKEGISAVLLQSGLNESWWADSMECYTHLRNVTELLSDGKTPYERRFGQPLKGPIIPFWSLVEYHPITAKDQSRIHQFGQKVLPGLFFGYALYAGGIWKGDVLIADLEELETMDASEIYSKRLNAKEGYFPKKENLLFQ